MGGGGGCFLYSFITAIREAGSRESIMSFVGGRRARKGEGWEREKWELEKSAVSVGEGKGRFPRDEDRRVPRRTPTPQHMHTHSCPCLSFERAEELSAKWRRGDRSNVMSVVSMQLQHVSAASLVITTSHRETRVFAFICSCYPPHPPFILPPYPTSSSSSSLGPLLWQQQSSTQEIDMYAGRKRIIGVSGLCVLVFLSLTHMFSHSAWLCMKT